VRLHGTFTDPPSETTSKSTDGGKNANASTADGARQNIELGQSGSKLPHK